MVGQPGVGEVSSASGLTSAVCARPWFTGVVGLVAAAVLASCGSSVESSHAARARSDVRWSALQSCVLNSTALEHGTVSNEPKLIRIYDGAGRLAAGITYEGTFTRAETQARLHKASTTAVPFESRTGQWLAISNVAYFFSFVISQQEIDLVVGCLERTYPGAPEWPPSVTLRSLSNPNSPYT